MHAVSFVLNCLWMILVAFISAKVLRKKFVFYEQRLGLQISQVRTSFDHSHFEIHTLQEAVR